MKIILTESQLKKYIFENLEYEGLEYTRNDRNEPISVKFNPHHKRIVDTSMFKDDGSKEFNYQIKYLPKTKVKSINLYNLKDINISKIWKHGQNKYGGEVEQHSSMEQLRQKNLLYIANIIKKEMSDVDYVLIPPSSSKLNTEIMQEVGKKLSNQSIKYYPDFFVKTVRNITIDYKWLQNIDNELDKLTNDEIIKLKQRINKWVKDEDIRDSRSKIKKFQEDINAIISYRQNNSIRGRYPKEVDDLNAQKQAEQNKIASLRGKGRDSTVDDKGNIKSWQIKSLEDKDRKAIKGFMSINPTYERMAHKFKNKKVIIFDDNLSSGATMDDCCLALQTIGVNLDDILVITLGVIEPTTYQKGNRRNFN